MKKLLIVFVSLAFVFILAACGGGDNNGPSGGIPQPTSSGTPADETKKEGAKTYGIGEAGEANGLSITIDKVGAPNPDILLNSAKEGHKFLQVHFTFKNISKETIETPRNKAICIVYEEGETGDSSNMASEEGSNVLPGGEKETMYRGYVELAPGESASGWMLYQRLANQEEITMHYYSEYINVPPDLVFRFTAE